MECALWCGQRGDLLRRYCKSEDPHIIYHRKGARMYTAESLSSLQYNGLLSWEEEQRRRRGEEKRLFLEVVDG